MSINFKYRGVASILHLNIRKEGSEREILAIDIKIIGETTADVLPGILGCTRAKALQFWDKKTDEKRPAFNGIAEVSGSAEFEHCEVLIDGHKFTDAKVRKFKFTPINGFLLNLTCQVSIADIHNSDVSFVCERMKSDVKVSIGSQPDLFDTTRYDDQEAGNGSV